MSIKNITTVLILCAGISSIGSSFAETTTSVLPIQHWTTANGANVYFVAERQLPMIDIEVIFNAGSAQDGADYGVANFTNAMLGEGAQNLTADEIAERFDSLGAQFNGSCSRDMAAISLRSLTDPNLLNPALDTFKQVLTQPNFATKNFNRVKNQLLQALLEKQQTPSALADEAFFNAIYGNYPYAHYPLGTADTLKRFTPNSLVTFYREHYVGTNATVVIVGDIEKAQATKIAEHLVGGLPKGRVIAATPEPIYQPANKKINIDYPSTQTYIRIGEIGVNRNNPAYFPLYVGNYVLGGGVLVSRLFKSVRDERGLTYNVTSSFVPLKDRGPFVTALQSNNETSNEAIKVTQDVISQFITNGPTEDELQSAKKNILGSFALIMSSNSNIVDIVATIGFYKLPLNYLDTYRGKITNITREQIQQAFSQQLHPQDMVIVTVGPEQHAPKS